MSKTAILTLTAQQKHTIASEIPAWDSHYTIPPQTVEVTEAGAEFQCIYHNPDKPALFGGVAVPTSRKVRADVDSTVQISRSKIAHWLEEGIAITPDKVARFEVRFDCQWFDVHTYNSTYETRYKDRELSVSPIYRQWLYRVGNTKHGERIGDSHDYFAHGKSGEFLKVVEQTGCVLYTVTHDANLAEFLRSPAFKLAMEIKAQYSAWISTREQAQQNLALINEGRFDEIKRIHA